MKQLMQRIALFSGLGCWVLIGIASRHVQPLKCQQEWKSGFTHPAINTKEYAATAACVSLETKNEALLPGRTMIKFIYY